MTLTTVMPWRLFRTTVASVHPLSPSLRRVRLVGAELEHFADPGYDQRVKLLVGGRPERLDPSDADWYAAWLALPEPDRPAMRTYTTRRVSRSGGRVVVDVDMVIHADPGPAGDWARGAAPGDAVVVVGPDARFDGDVGGRTFAPPAGTQDVVLVGDETALPAIARTLEDLRDRGPQRRVTAIIEVPVAEDRLDLARPAGAELVWLVRGRRVPGVALDRALRTWTTVAAGPRPLGALRSSGLPDDPEETLSPEDPEEAVLWDVPPSPGTTQGPVRSPLPFAYVWVAGETGVVRGIRRHLLTELGLDRAQVALMGYWRLGTALA